LKNNIHLFEVVRKLLASDYLSLISSILSYEKSLTNESITKLQDIGSKIQYRKLCAAPNCFSYLELLTNNFTTNLDKIDWDQFNTNTNLKLIDVLEQNPSFIRWGYLSMNPIAIRFLEKHQEHTEWYWLSLNPAIIETDNERHKTRLSIATKFVYDL
jgi:hypothetical protein